mmetsp:Transcript_10767/g.19150  ORF Transcript_10767/g.19150 Transcript_10767/m.19150 type:complete len:223 (-) Transcript_10767:4909-5577(-)
MMLKLVDVPHGLLLQCLRAPISLRGLPSANSDPLLEHLGCQYSEFSLAASTSHTSGSWCCQRCAGLCSSTYNWSPWSRSLCRQRRSNSSRNTHWGWLRSSLGNRVGCICCSGSVFRLGGLGDFSQHLQRALQVLLGDELFIHKAPLDNRPGKLHNLAGLWIVGLLEMLSEMAVQILHIDQAQPDKIHCDVLVLPALLMAQEQLGELLSDQLGILFPCGLQHE